MPSPGTSPGGPPPPGTPHGGPPPGTSPSGGGYSPYGGGPVPPAPPPPAYDAERSPRSHEARNGIGTAALVLGVIAVVVSLIPVLNFFTWPLGILAIVFGAVGWNRANKGQATNKKLAIAGLVLGVVSFLVTCLIYVLIGAGSDTMFYNATPMP
jgi:hypothetical protein